MANGGYTSEQLRRFIEATGESGNIGAKRSLPWDGAADSACLAKVQKESKRVAAGQPTICDTLVL
jgi:hypothetical protein